MNTAHLKFAKVYFLILVFLASNLCTLAQKPPTGGPNPTTTKEFNLTPFIIAGGGIALGAITRVYLKKRGPKIAVSEHLPTYLLNRNILPTPDAINLMYKLNPRLNNLEVIRANQKLVNPDFPEVPKSQLNTSSNPVQTTTSMPASVKEQVNIFKSTMNTFRRTKISINSGDKSMTMDRINSILKEIEKDIISPEHEKEESNTIKDQLKTDLLKALNQTLKKTITTKILGPTETTLIKEIMENLSELLLPVINNKLNLQNSSQLLLKNLTGEESKVYAATDINPVLFAEVNPSLKHKDDFANGTSTIDDPVNTNMIKGFAFAIYKLDNNGVPITKGFEVEGQYFIQYVMPALKSIPDAYHSISPPLASFASAFLPPAKYFFVVKDINGKQIALQNPLIDTKDAFKNPQRKEVNEMIIVPIFVSK